MNPALPANERGKWSSLFLATLVHVALGLFLFFGVRWQNRLPDPVEVELVSAPPPPLEKPAQPTPQLAETRPQPPAPKPEPEPEPAPPPPRKQPDIAIKAPEPKKPEPKPVKEVEKPVVKPPKPEPKKPEPKPEPKKPEPRPEPKKPEPAKVEKADKTTKPAEKTDQSAKADAERNRRLEEMRRNELIARDSERVSNSKQIQEELARVAGAQASAARNKAQEAYIEKIRAKVKGNIVLPPGVNGDPFATFYVDQLPDGSVIDVRLKRSTGTPQLDAAIERAIQKSSPLPKPDKPEIFNRTLELKFYPLRD